MMLSPTCSVIRQLTRLVKPGRSALPHACRRRVSLWGRLPFGARRKWDTLDGSFLEVRRRHLPRRDCDELVLPADRLDHGSIARPSYLAEPSRPHAPPRSNLWRTATGFSSSGKQRTPAAHRGAPQPARGPRRKTSSDTSEAPRPLETV